MKISAEAATRNRELINSLQQAWKEKETKMEEQQTAANEQYVPSLAIMLNLNELNFIIEKLAKNPYEEVAGVIEKVRYQAIQQLQPQQQETPAE